MKEHTRDILKLVLVLAVVMMAILVPLILFAAWQLQIWD